MPRPASPRLRAADAQLVAAASLKRFAEALAEVPDGKASADAVLALRTVLILGIPLPKCTPTSTPEAA